MAQHSINARQVFCGALLATAVVVLCSARPPLSPRGRDGVRYHQVVQEVPTFELRTPTKRDSIVAVAWATIGTRYERGGADQKSGFDCSGLVRFVLGKVHLNLPRLAYQQALLGRPVTRDHLLPGDLLTFGADSISHIGIYIGEGKFVHASSKAGRVIVSSLDRRSPALVPLSGARRLLAAR
jgi:cell wall-associated NlpC family hydrolase